MIRYMRTTAGDRPGQLRELHRIAGANYIYLGYAVRNLEDVRLLARARREHPDFDPASDIITSSGTI